MLFENEIFNITNINNVIYYKPKHLAKYRGKLPFYEIMYYAEGESVISFNGEKYEMSENKILYLPKGIDNEDYSIFIKKPVKLYNIYFDTDSQLPQKPMVISAKSAEIANLFEKIFHTWVYKKECYYYKAVRYFYNIAELVKKSQPFYLNSKKYELLKKSEDFMLTHYCDYKFNFKEMQKITGLSYSYFKKLFIEKYGMPPVKYVNKLKINRACELLISNRFTVSEISEMCGFENTYYFSTVFKNYMGVSPKQFSKENIGIK